jgi:hypothetical protein
LIVGASGTGVTLIVNVPVSVTPPDVAATLAAQPTETAARWHGRLAGP